MRKKTILAGLLLLALGLSGCAQKAEPGPEIALLEPVGVELDSAAAYIGDLNQITTYDSAVTPEVEELHMTVDGTVKKMYVTLGDLVKKGDVLLELDESDTQEAYDRLAEQIEYTQTVNDYDNRMAQIDIDLLKNQLRALQAAQGGAEQQKQIELKQVEIEQAELNLRQARERQQLSLETQKKDLQALGEKLGKNLLVAPCDGRVAYAASLQEGDWLTAYRPVAYIADESRLYLSGESISTSLSGGATEMYALINGGRYEITPREMEREDYIALVLAGNDVPACFDFEAGEDVEAGMYAAVCLVTKARENVLLIPTNALLRGGGGRYVYVLGENGERTRRAVKTGVSTAWLTEITEGLEEGEVVYVKD